MTAPSIPYDERPYRPCVGIFLINRNGMVFAGRRIDSLAEAWQMPQGGIDLGEKPRQACLREMEEEIGTREATVIHVIDEWLEYDIPMALAEKLWHGQYKGQKQKWILLRFDGSDADINIETAEPEFCAWKWFSPDRLIDLAVPFKRDVYRHVLSTFKPYIKKAQ